MARRTRPKDEAEFLAAIHADPKDDAARMVFADWLLQKNDPRGELINVQCELSTLDPDDPYAPRANALATRQRELLQQHGETWTKPLMKYGQEFTFRRGFVEIARTTLKSFAEKFDALRAAEPLIRIVRLTHATSRVIELLPPCPHLTLLDTLDLSSSNQNASRTQFILQSPNLGGLRSLYLGDNSVLQMGAKALARTSFPSLRVLFLPDAEIGTRGLGFIAQSKGLPLLEELYVARNGILPDAVAALVAAAFFPRLTRLELAGNPIGEAGVAMIARSEGTKGLTWLDLHRTGLSGPAAARAIAASPHLASLEWLDLGHNLLGDDGIVELTRSPYLSGLRHLRLDETAMGERGAKALAEVAATSWRSLKTLHTSGNKLGFTARVALAKQFGEPYADRWRRTDEGPGTLRARPFE